jgi:hypothetical protein
MTAARKAQKLVTEIDEAELCCLIVEGMSGLRRPADMSPTDALKMMDIETQEGARRAARKIMAYWSECIAKLQPTN